MHEDERDTIDERIDTALRRYAEAPQFSEPRMALARVRALAGQERRPSLWVWAAPLAVAVLIAAVWAFVLRVPQTPQIAWVPKAPGVANVEAPTHGKPTGIATAGTSTRGATRCCAERHGTGIRSLAQNETRTLPKQEVFPTPQPLSPQERALLSFVNQAPLALKEQMLAAQKQVDGPIEIADIQIKPLDDNSGEPQTKGKDLP